MRFPGPFVAAMLVLASAVLVGAPVRAEPVLAAVQKRGHLLCGANGHAPSFSVVDAQGQWSGFEVDFCRAIAAAVLGDATKVHFVPVSTADRFDALRQGRIDVLTRNTIDTLERTTGTGVRDAAVIYLDRQVVVVARDLQVGKLAELNKGTICTLSRTPYATAIDDWFGARNLTAKTVLFDSQDALYKALYDGTCRAVSQVMAPMASTVIASGQAAKYIVLPDLVALHPLAAYVKAGDDPWYDVVRWTFNALLHGEELKVGMTTADAERSSANPEVRRLLGVEPAFGKLLGLDESWAFNLLKQVGNYAEIYERNVGKGSPLGFARGVNALWSEGGILFPMPMR